MYEKFSVVDVGAFKRSHTPVFAHDERDYPRYRGVRIHPDQSDSRFSLHHWNRSMNDGRNSIPQPNAKKQLRAISSSRVLTILRFVPDAALERL